MPLTAPGGPVVVVIDDDDPFLDLMRDILEAEGYRVVTGSVVGDALRLIVEANPALVILDLVMSTQEAGIDVLRAMRTSLATARTPVLLMTANHQFVRERLAEMRALEAEVMTKPFNLQELIDLVGALVRKLA